MTSSGPTPPLPQPDAASPLTKSIDTHLPGAPDVSPEGVRLDTTERVPFRGRFRRLALNLVFANFSLFMIYGAVPTILLPIQIQQLDPANKVANLALVTSVAVFAAMIVQPVAGILSDRTRSRLGRRAPWMLGGAVATGAALIALSFSQSILAIAILWTATIVAVNFVQSPLSAVMPDRVPRVRRGTFATFIGLGLIAGGVGGSAVAAALSTDLSVAYLVFAIVPVLAMLNLVLRNRDHSSAGLERPKASLKEYAKTFWVNPRKHPDFFWAFTNRLVIFTAYYIVNGYLFYILQDYVGLGGAAVGYVPLLGGINLLFSLVTISLFGPLSDRLGRRKIIVVLAAIVIGVAFIAPWVSPTLIGVMIYAALSGAGFGVYQSVDSALMSEVLPSQKSFGKDLGVLNFAQSLPQIIAPAIAGSLVIVGGYAALFPVGLAIAVLGALTVLPIRSVR
ncbi:MFS transporter [Microbacteriaceae bacterium VKM Ac-2855]|nr:MFS transporter [Microbacteriaceae bacterium VKM Ac-2855]